MSLTSTRRRTAAWTTPQARGWIEDVLLFVWPLFTLVALYLPSGLLMPARLEIVAFAVLAAWRLVDRHRAGEGWLSGLPVRTLVGLLIAFATLGVFGLIGLARFRHTDRPVEFVYLAFAALACASLAVLARGAHTLRVLFRGWLLAIAASGVVAIWEIVTAHHLPKNTPGQYWPGLRPGWNIIASFYDNPNLYAYMLAAFMALVPFAASLERDRRLRWIYWLAFLASGLFLYYTQGRLAEIGVVVAFIIWFWRNRRARIAMIALAAIVLIGWLLKIPKLYGFANQLGDAFRDWKYPGRSTWVRINLAKAGWWMLTKSDFLGVGPGGFEQWDARSDNPYKWGTITNPHSAIVEISAQYGLIALCVVIAVFVAAGWLAVRRARQFRRADPGLAAGGWQRMLAIGTLIAVVTLPFVTSSHSTWIRQPLTTVHLATITLMCAVLELLPRSRALRDSAQTAQAGTKAPGTKAPEAKAH